MKYIDEKKFQFLIGRLKTAFGVPPELIGDTAFQFLIGRLKTGVGLGFKLDCVEGFNSL